MGWLLLENGQVIKLKKTKFSNPIFIILNIEPIIIYLRREIYHCPITIINIVRTKGKAGYLVWKLAGGQGDQDINLPWGSLTETCFCEFLDTELSVANPLPIVQIK